jgi:hypothetical protein
MKMKSFISSNVYIISMATTSFLTTVAAASLARELASTVSDGSSCFTYQDAVSSFEEAVEVCENVGGFVAFSSDTDTLTELNEYVASISDADAWWMGAQATSGCTFTTQDKADFVDIPWNDGEPNGCDSCDKDATSGECCVQVYTSTGLWNDLSCSGTMQPFFCETSGKCTTDDDDDSDEEQNICLENGQVDDDCCAVPDSAGCIDGYTYSYDDSDDGICYEGDDFTCYWTLCEECIDAYDTGAMDRPWDDFIDCESEAPYCDENENVRRGCAKTCDACGEDFDNDDTDNDEMYGSAVLEYELCNGCEELFAASGVDFDWENCLSQGLELIQGEDDFAMYWQSDGCDNINFEVDSYTEFSAHTIGFEVTYLDQYQVYVIIAANTGDGTLQVAWSASVIQMTAVVELKILDVDGEILGWEFVPDGVPIESSIDYALATLTLVDFEDYDEEDNVNFCRDLLAGICPDIQEAMVSGDWTVKIVDESDVYVTWPDTCEQSDSDPVFEDVTNINAASFLVYEDGYIILWLGEPDDWKISAFAIDFTSDEFCLLEYDIESVEGVFLGITEGSYEDDDACDNSFCNDISCATWVDLGITTDDLVENFDCDECNECLDEVDPCKMDCGEYTCIALLERGYESVATRLCSFCSECYGDDADDDTGDDNDLESEGVCLENREVDDDCCAIPDTAGCIDGYTYSYDSSDDGICYLGDGWTAYYTQCTEDAIVDANDEDLTCSWWTCV